ncbi:MAG TPA: protein-glutamine glutaminase family protein [Pyrinomonadaceae bacterium]
MAREKDTGLLTVATIRKGKDGEEILFNERQQIFTFGKAVKSPKDASGYLKEAIKKKTPVRAVLDPKRASIDKIEIPDAEEIREFRKNLVLEKRPAKPVKLDLREIDPTTFNVADVKLKWPVFRLCKKFVPNYAKAKEIFDFCAEQSCHLSPPYDISPCIPFQYVRDGCYARAHKMRRIITTKYGYCCEKVFSFANQGQDRLAVKADKWGGCCVTWWYHVAPLIRVKVRILRCNFVLAMVIDPGMFNNPVLLSTWLAAQENTACHASANVSMYSIQAGSAYTPASYTGTSFSTDPAYTHTDATLVNYAGLTTC